MRFTLIGNSGSGKSTLAKALAELHGLAMLDLDTVFFEPGQPVARDPAASRADVEAFCRAHESWVIEGCYASLADATLAFQPELIFLDPGVETCLAHCAARPWEPHKYASKEAQDNNLALLREWVQSYYTRDDEMSHAAHQALFDAYDGSKRRLTRAATLNELSHA
jgi:adenylate kinase family enzyme